MKKKKHVLFVQRSSWFKQVEFGLFGGHYRRMKKPKKFDNFLYRHCKRTGHSSTKVSVQPVEKNNLWLEIWHYQKAWNRIKLGKIITSSISTWLIITLYGPRQANLVLITYASSEGSGEPAHPRSLSRTFAARSYKQWIKRKLQTESQIPGYAQLEFVMTECSKTQIRLTGLISWG